jgi:hypothetical protein
MGRYTYSSEIVCWSKFYKVEFLSTVHQLFIDFKKAHDSVRREVLYNILIEFGVPLKLVRLIKMCSKGHVGKHLSDNCPVHNGLKQRDALRSLLFNFSLEYALMKVQENQVGLKLSGKHQVLIYSDDENRLGDNLDTMKKNTQSLTIQRGVTSAAYHSEDLICRGVMGAARHASTLTHSSISQQQREKI